ncbi:single-stranded DNA-binding protein [Candidatus Peregrinibacteria bacterium]|nr:single-stranded DNA-binding protein [Candidatus Peregrinibacteria bacterium]
MRSLNRVCLMGHLTADPELRQTKSGISVANFHIATNRFIKDGKEKKEIADYHTIVAWNKLAEICEKYLSKGAAVYVEGMLVNRSFEKDGKKHYRTEVILDNLNILTFKKTSSGKEEVGIKSLKDDVNDIDIEESD